MKGEGRWMKEGWSRREEKIGFEQWTRKVQLLPRADPR
jgi:hypothetical protein